MDKTLYTDRLTLPLVADMPDEPEHGSSSEWHGWQAIGAMPLRADPAADAPEPLAPQGEYNLAGSETPLELPTVSAAGKDRSVELLAPAGGMEAGLAALHFGADAIYLGLKKFSARAEAENFTFDEVEEITAYAHSLTPRRRVFVTVNTLLRQDELAELVEVLTMLEDIGVDAVILQDLGVYHLARRFFPGLELHGSTQMSVHNGAGAAALRRLGFQRVVLARELTFEEVGEITSTGGVETEVFIHGALCYAYSGLCLFSSQTLGRSGNRGKCAYSCRDSFQVTGAPPTLRDGSPVRRDPQQGFPFSMKDLALPDHLPALRAAGVSCFKVEGRKKSPLYVATTTDYYRRLLDHRLAEEERPRLESDLQTVFSRPWTRLFVQSHKDKEVADRDTVGHRGTLIGKVEKVIGAGTRQPRLRFHSKRPLQRHDGLQVDLPVLGKPYGFAVDHLWVMRKGKAEEALETPTGAMVEVALPPDAPELPVGAPVYCSSSQAVKQRYHFDHPREGVYRNRRGLTVKVRISVAELTAVGQVSVGGFLVEARAVLPGPFGEARDPSRLQEILHDTFAKLGNTRFFLNHLEVDNPEDSFVPVSRLNQVRRELTERLDVVLQQRLRERVAAVAVDVVPRKTTSPATEAFRWSIKVDRAAFLDAFTGADLVDVEEVILDIARDSWPVLQAKVEELTGKFAQERIRFALPALTRRWEDRGLRFKIEQLQQAGWRKWEAANLSAWTYLGLDAATGTAGDIDLATDWSIYVLNRLAARQLLAMGVRRFTLSPEDGIGNLRSLLAEFANQATVIVHQDTPLFLAESCAYANLIGGCPGKANCSFESMDMVSSHGERVTALDYHCRTIVLNQGPFCLSAHLRELAKAGAVHLRADFIYRKYDSQEVRQIWESVRSGRPLRGAHSANFRRGIL
jgi:putative protease